MINKIKYFEIPMDYDMMTLMISEIEKAGRIAQVTSIGKSYLDRELWCIKIGTGEKKAIYVGAHHAMEWVTSQILIRFIYDVLGNKPFGGFDVEDSLGRYTLYIVPMLNPDGVDININGLSPDNPYYQTLLFQNNASEDFSHWQANIRGVDLNHNYDAGWENNKQSQSYYGIYSGAPTRYSGAFPESEKESAALAKLTREIDPDIVLALHSQGEEIYYDFMEKVPPKAKNIALMMSQFCGYKLSVPEGIASYGGYKDWFIDKFNKPGFTIEIGYGENPLPLQDFSKIYRQIRELLLILPIL